jgi:ABC-type nitrate/sulfonate/bicarbonate transport system substrate-binding protein
MHNSSERIALAAIIIITAAAAGLFAVKQNDSLNNSGEVVIRVTRSGTAPTDWEFVKELTGRDVLKEEGVKLDEIYGSGSAGWLPMMILMTDKVDVSGGGWPGWINARARGGKIKAVLGGGSSYQNWPGKKAGLLVLENSSIHSVKDLAGKIVAVNVLGLTGDYIVKLMLKKNGIPLNKVQIIAVPAENQEQVLRSKQVDAVADTTSGGPNFDRILDRGGVRVIPGTGKYEVLGSADSTGTGFREEFIEKHPEAVRRYVSAVEKARRILWDEFKRNPERVKSIHAGLVREKGGNPDLSKYYLPPIHLPSYQYITGAEIQRWIEVMESEGQLKPGQVKAEDVYTNEYNEYYEDHIRKKQKEDKKI